MIKVRYSLPYLKTVQKKMIEKHYLLLIINGDYFHYNHVSNLIDYLEKSLKEGKDIVVID